MKYAHSTKTFPVIVKLGRVSLNSVLSKPKFFPSISCWLGQIAKSLLKPLDYDIIVVSANALPHHYYRATRKATNAENL